MFSDQSMTNWILYRIRRSKWWKKIKTAVNYRAAVTQIINKKGKYEKIMCFTITKYTEFSSRPMGLIPMTRSSPTNDT